MQRHRGRLPDRKAVGGEPEPLQHPIPTQFIRGPCRLRDRLAGLLACARYVSSGVLSAATRCLAEGLANRSLRRSGALPELRSDDPSAIPPGLEVGRWSGCHGNHATLGCRSPAVRRRTGLPPAGPLRLLLQVDQTVEPALSARWS